MGSTPDLVSVEDETGAGLDHSSDPVLPERAALASARAALRQEAPLVQCLTNRVVSTITANALLAVGASPAMVDNAHEAAQFAALASAVLVNLGTPDDATAAAMRLAAASAAEHQHPWVLDPVAVGPLDFRTALAVELLEHRPTVVRANASEIIALEGAAGGLAGLGGRGTDATSGVDEALEAARALAQRTGGVVAVSGAVDLITDGQRVVRVEGGHVLLTRTTGAGCALGALVAAYAGAVADPLVAAVAAHAHVALAAQAAATSCTGPGSFAIDWLDALDATTPEAIAAANVRSDA